MPAPAIRVRNLSKQYQIGAREARPSSFREALTSALRAPLRRFRDLSGRGSEAETFWALKDVSFDIEEGEVVGIIGRNGAGKSTLLKILSQITEPTSGEIELHGRVGSLLEVGTGFHPELSGRENIYLNGAILGMKREEITKRFDEIVAFAEVEQFLDTPVKRYSSGMYMRLAFAVAAHLDPEVLIVDEVLAVGDSEFQRKCLGKMGKVAQDGRTVIFVSHNLAAIQRLCNQSIMLQLGRLATQGTTSEVVASYLQAIEPIEGDRRAFHREPQSNGDPTIVSGSALIEGQQLRIDISIFSDVSRCVSLDLHLKDKDCNPICFGSIGAFDSDARLALTPGLTKLSFVCPISNLASGAYVASMDLTEPNVRYCDRLYDCLRIDVEDVHFPEKRRLQQSWGLGCIEVPLELISPTRAS